MNFGVQLFLVALAVSTLANLGLGIYVLRYGRGGKVNLLFFLLMTLLFLWQVTVPAPLITKAYETVLIVNRLGVFPALPIPGLFIHFSYLFVSRKLHPRVAFLVYLPAVAMAPFAFVDLFAGGSYFIEKLKDEGGILLPDFGYAFYIYGLYLMGSGIWGCAVLLRALVMERNYLFRNQIKYVALGIGGIISFYFLVEVVLPLIMGRRFLSPTSLGTVFMDLCIAYGITRSRPSDLGEFLRKGITYLVAIDLSLLIYLSVVWGMGYRVYLLDTVLLLTLLPLFGILLGGVGLYVEKALDRDKSLRQSILRDVEGNLYWADLSKLSQALIDSLWEAMQVESCALLLQEGGWLTVFQSKGLNPDRVKGVTFGVDEDFVSFISRYNRPVDTEEVLLSRGGKVPLFSFTEVRLSELGSALNVPLKADGRLVGILCLGRKRGSGVFIGSDRQSLESLAAKVGPALGSSIAYEGLKKENIRLRELGGMA